MKLLTGNRKLELAEGKGYLTAGVALTPGGWRCAFYEFCLTECIGFHAGMNSIPRNRKLKDERSRFLQVDPAGFMRQLNEEIAAFCVKAKRKDMKVAIRLNTYSDIAWERGGLDSMAGLIPTKGFFERWSHVKFYDYTKDHRRLDDWIKGRNPKNYYLNYSHNGQKEDILRVWKAYHGRVNPVIVANDVKRGKGGKPDEPFPKRWCGVPVIDGDKHDARFLDPKGIVMLRQKGKRTRIAINIKDKEVKDRYTTGKKVYRDLINKGRRVI